MAYANGSSTVKLAADPTLRPDTVVFRGDYRVLAPLEDPTSALFQGQASLPALPVPDLRASLSAYLEAVAASATAEQLEKARTDAYAFLAPTGLGPTLQERLLARRDEYGTSSWLQDWWNRYSYLEYREPVVVYVSYFFHFVDDPLLGTGPLAAIRDPMLERAAVLTRATLDVREGVKDKTADPPRGRKPGDFKCAVGYNMAFNSCRIPAPGSDVAYIYATQEHQSNDLDHVVVLRRGRFFKVSTTTAAAAADGGGRRLLSVAELAHQFRNVVSIADLDASTPRPCVGCLTAGNRDRWAADRAELLKAPGNAAVLEAIQSAVFVLCLDAEAPVTKEEVARELWHSGNAHNRWFDKTIQLVVFANGKAGMIGEHSLYDGVVSLDLCTRVLGQAGAVRSAAGRECPVVQPGSLSPSSLVPLEFDVSRKVAWAVRHAQGLFSHLVSNHHLHTLTFDGYGSVDIKKRFRSSPDAWLQVAIQLAYAYQFGECKATYEPVSMNRYRHGRTECVRGMSTAAVAFCQAMLAPSGGAGAATGAQRASKLRVALDAHSRNTARAAKGEGFERHLLGLRLLMDKTKGESAELFDDPLFFDSCHWYVSTSNLSSPLLENWGWGEVVTDGIGVAYNIKAGEIDANVTCCQGFSKHFVHHLRRALVDMARLAGKKGKAPRTEKPKGHSRNINKAMAKL